METVAAVAEMQALAERARAAGRRLALVPTMGAFHEGHLALVREARRRVGPGGHVTVSVFVNPTQFGPGEDFEAYPRTLDADRAALAALDDEGVTVDAVFAPTAAEMYPFGLPPWATVHVRDLGRHLCGPFRPGHFDGVATVVARLFLAARPHVAVFGEKDAQQLAVVRRMAAEMGFGVEVAGVPTVREGDGLARSSRNRYLAPAERARAAGLSRGLFAARNLVAGGERRADRLVAAMQGALGDGVRVQYAEVVDADTLAPVETLAEAGPSGGRYLAAVAAYVGATRLIDNVPLRVGAGAPPGP